jgi:N6-L-threonylcarbamoyladenine synthase
LTLLAFETSCDETSAAVVQDGRVLSNVVSSQVRLHSEYGGVVPELAAREHLRNLVPVATRALADAGVTPDALTLLAATRGPGLPSALMMGFRAAQAMAFALRRPVIGIHHHEAHLYSPWISGTPPAANFDAFEPNASLIVSGGHTLLVHVRAELDHHWLGSTLDDAAGECFDKVGKLLGLPYPAGPQIDRLAEKGDPKRFTFPRPLVDDPGDDFSFSGLKTAVRYFLRDHPGLADDLQALHDLCAGVQAAIVEVLVRKTVRAATRLRVRCVTASGGVTCNRHLRDSLESACTRAGIRCRLAEKTLCTDNAAMIGVLAERKFLRGDASATGTDDVLPGWDLQHGASGSAQMRD